MAREAIFIGYRRDDTADVAGRIYDALERKFGRDRLFKDVDNLRPGADFGAYIKSVLPRCQVALILIGPGWLDARDEAGARRLEDANDWVRIEIETALATPGLDVVPVLVNGARMPKSDELPPSLHPLLRRHAAVIRRDPDFRDDVAKLSAALSEQVKTGLLDLGSIAGERKAQDGRKAERRKNRQAAGAWLGGILLFVVAVLAFVVWRSMDVALTGNDEVISFVWPSDRPDPPPTVTFTAELRPSDGRELVPGTSAFAMSRADSAYLPGMTDYWPHCQGATTLVEDTPAHVVYRGYLSANRGQQCHANWSLEAKQRAARAAARGGATDQGEESQAPSTTVSEAATSPPTPTLRAGQVFRDCEDCPEMVAIPAGSFLMGSPADEAGHQNDEGPQHRVTLNAFAVGRYEITFDQWATCVNRGGCATNPHPEDVGFTRGSRPVINVSWNDAQEYLRWLSRETGKSYRLLSEAEWEYAARAGTTSAYSTGSSITVQQARFDRTATAPVGSYQANPWGLYDMHGNVWEWVQDCYANSYSGLPTDGSAYQTGTCSQRVFRGGSWYGVPEYLRSARRSRAMPSGQTDSLGFRVARST